MIHFYSTLKQCYFSFHSFLIKHPNKRDKYAISFHLFSFFSVISHFISWLYNLPNIMLGNILDIEFN